MAIKVTFEKYDIIIKQKKEGFLRKR